VSTLEYPGVVEKLAKVGAIHQVIDLTGQSWMNSLLYDIRNEKKFHHLT
jgi:hypothetical protein